MNTLMLVALAVVVFCYCGGKYCPSVLKQNKEVVLGVLVGMALCLFAGLKLEGFQDLMDTSTFLDCLRVASRAPTEENRTEKYQFCMSHYGVTPPSTPSPP